MRYIITALAALPLLAHAQTAELTWEPPSAYQNGDVLNPAEDLEGYPIYVDGEQVDMAPPESEGYTVEVSYGHHEFHVTALGTNGQESAPSNVVAETILDDRVPESPSLIDVIVGFLRDAIRAIGGLLA